MHIARGTATRPVSCDAEAASPLRATHYHYHTRNASIVNRKSTQLPLSYAQRINRKSQIYPTTHYHLPTIKAERIPLLPPVVVSQLPPLNAQLPTLNSQRATPNAQRINHKSQIENSTHYPLFNRKLVVASPLYAPRRRIGKVHRNPLLRSACVDNQRALNAVRHRHYVGEMTAHALRIC